MAAYKKYRITTDNASITIDMAMLRVEDSEGNDLRFPRREFTLLAHFVRAPRELQKNEALRALLWGDDDHTGKVDNAIAALRKKLRECLNTDENYIVNTAGVGYTFEAGVEDVGDEIVSNDDEDEKRIKSWQAHWERVQDQPLIALEMFLHLKRPIGRDKCVELLKGTMVHLDDARVTLDSVFSQAEAPNSVRRHRKKQRDAPIVSFWERYDEQNSACREGEEIEIGTTVTGFTISIPWLLTKAGTVTKLSELYAVKNFGVAIDDGLLRVGVDECSVTFVGEDFSFVFSMLDEGAIALLEEISREMRKAQAHSKNPRLPLFHSRSGSGLLDTFYQGGLPVDPAIADKRRRGGFGLTGLTKEITFYPDMPKTFLDSEEHSDYSITVPMPATTDWQASVEKFRALTLENPDNLEHQHNLAFALRMTGESGEALDVLQDIVDGDEFHLGSYRLMAYLLERDFGLSEDALQVTKVISSQDDPETAVEGHTESAYILARMGSADIGLSDHIEPLIAEHVESDELYVCQGILLSVLDRKQEAQEAFELAIKVEPKNVKALVYLGLGLIDTDISTAMEYLSSAVEAEPDSTLANKEIGKVCYSHLKDSKRALAHLRKAAEDETENLELWQLVFACANDIHDFDTAESAARNALHISGSSENYLYVAIVLQNKKEYAEAMEYVNRGLDVEPGDESLVSLQASIERKIQAST